MKESIQRLDSIKIKISQMQNVLLQANKKDRIDEKQYDILMNMYSEVSDQISQKNYSEFKKECKAKLKGTPP